MLVLLPFPLYSVLTISIYNSFTIQLAPSSQALLNHSHLGYSSVAAFINLYYRIVRVVSLQCFAHSKEGFYPFRLCNLKA